MSFGFSLDPDEVVGATTQSVSVVVTFDGQTPILSVPLAWTPLPASQGCGVEYPYLADGPLPGEVDPPDSLEVVLVDEIFPALWGTTNDEDENGVCDIDEFHCMESALASGEHPALVKAFFRNRANAEQDLRSFRTVSSDSGLVCGVGDDGEDVRTLGRY